MPNSLTRRTLKLKWVSSLILLVLLAGCASRAMQFVPDNMASYSPRPGKGVIVFMRPSLEGVGNRATVFDITTGDPQLVGIVSAKTKVAYYANSGKNLFMVIGETADFLEADIQEGKTYYSLIVPQTGMWKIRFSLRPFHKEELSSKKFENSYINSKWVENTPASYGWAKRNMSSIQIRKNQYLPEWKRKSERPTLHVTDGK